MKQRWADVAIAAALALVTWVIYRRILRLWWMLDVPNHLLMLAPISPRDIFTRHFTALLGKPLFTPLQYAMLRLWCWRAASAAAALVTIAGVPAMNIVPVLMLRHYVEGGVLAVAAVILFVLALRRERMWLSIASALLCLGASLYKEIFVPLPLILLALRVGGRRYVALIPHALAAVAYAILRISLLGTSTESYDFITRPGERWKMIATLPLRAFGLFGIPMAIALVVCIAIIFIRLRGARWVIVACAFAALLPIIPVATQLQPRWSFALWLVSASAIAFVELALPRYGLIAIGLVVVTALASFRVEWPRAYRRFLQMSDEARVFAMLDKGDVMLNAATPPVTLQQLAGWTHAQGRAVYDELPLCRDANPPRRVFQYDPNRREVRDVGNSVLAADCARIRTAPLFAHFSFDGDGAFYWSLGPYRDGRWVFVLGEDIAYEVSRDAGFRAAGLPELTIRVRYESPAGWMTYSPDLRLDLRSRRAMNFDRR